MFGRQKLNGDLLWVHVLGASPDREGLIPVQTHPDPAIWRGLAFAVFFTATIGLLGWEFFRWIH